MKKLLQINPVIRINTSTGRIMQEIGELARANGWETYIAYSQGRDGVSPNAAHLIPVGNRWSVAWHGIMTRLFDRHGLASERATRQLIAEIQRIQPDIIHIHNIHGYFLNYRILFEYLSNANIPVIWTVHDCWLYTGHCYHYSYKLCGKWKNQCLDCPQRKDFPTSWWVDRSKQNFLDKKKAFTSVPKDLMTFVTVSEWMKNEMKMSFLKDYPYQVIHNGINLENFQVYPADEVKKRYGLEGKRILLGVASIWMEEKGWNDFMQLGGMLNPDEVIVLVGVKEEQKKGLPATIVPISRTDNLKQLAELYAAAEALVNPTWQDNYPTVNLEAIACGTPVVTYRTGGSIEVITPDTGFIVEQGDIPGLLAAVRTIEERGKDYYQTKCRAYAEAHFRKEDRYADYLKLYENLTSR